MTGKKQRGKTWIKYAGTRTPKTFFPPSAETHPSILCSALDVSLFFQRKKNPGNLHIVLDGAVQSLGANARAEQHCGANGSRSSGHSLLVSLSIWVTQTSGEETLNGIITPLTADPLFDFLRTSAMPFYFFPQKSSLFRATNCRAGE